MTKMNFRIYKEEDSILFNSKLDNYVLSNMYPCKLLYEGKVFHSVEQLFHWMIFSENEFVREEIMKFKGVCNGFQVKNFCTKHADKIDKDYDSKKYKCLTKCLEIKFLQCFEFRKAVLDSGSKNLVEYAPWDSEFGAKWDSWEEAYTGINACGRCMMMIRENAINGMYSI